MKNICVMSLGLLWILLTGVGCATTMRGENQKIKFETDPEGATVKIADKTYTTPSPLS